VILKFQPGLAENAEGSNLSLEARGTHIRGNVRKSAETPGILTSYCLSFERTAGFSQESHLTDVVTRSLDGLFLPLNESKTACKHSILYRFLPNLSSLLMLSDII
jgi:hypothetical protein